MSELLRDVLRERAAVPPPVFDAAGLVTRAERRIRRRRLIGVVAAVVVMAVVAAGLVLVPRLHDDPAPVDRPARFVEHRLTYVQAGVVHYGNQTFDTGVLAVMALARTPYGFLLATYSGNVWFSDGSTAEKVGLDVAARHSSAVTADATGPLAAWVETADDGVAELVVYDSRRAVVVARVSGGPADEAAPPDVVAVDDQAVYWSQRPGTGDPLLRYDVATGEQEAVDLPSLAYVADVADGVFAYGTSDLGAYRVVVASPRARSTIEGLLMFDADLSPDGSYLAGHGRRGLGVFEVATGQQVSLQPPRGYGAHQFMGWVDRNTVAVWDHYKFTILTCAVPSGSCQVAVQDPGDPGVWRPLFPEGYQPG